MSSKVKDKEKSLSIVLGKKHTGVSVILTIDILAGNLQTSKEW